jgi:hypothetical protein
MTIHMSEFDVDVEVDMVATGKIGILPQIIVMAIDASDNKQDSPIASCPIVSSDESALSAFLNLARATLGSWVTVVRKIGSGKSAT